MKRLQTALLAMMFACGAVIIGCIIALVWTPSSQKIDVLTELDARIVKVILTSLIVGFTAAFGWIGAGQYWEGRK